MSKINKRIAAVLVFLLILTIFIIVLSNFFKRPNVDEKYRDFFEEKNDYDVLFFGTSHAYNSILPQELWKEHGIVSYNLGQSSCSLPIEYYLLKLACKYTNPKIAVFDLYDLVEKGYLGNGKCRAEVRDLQRVGFDAFPLSLTKIEAVNDIFDDYDNRIDFLFPLTIYHNRWTSIGESEFSPRSIPQKGAAFVLGTCVTFNNETEAANIHNITCKAIEYIPKIMDFCREKGIKVIFTFLPHRATDLTRDAAASLGEILKGYPDCTYLNMLYSGMLDYETDIHLDGSHVNYLGSRVITSWLGDYLVKNYPELDKSKDERYAEKWDKQYEEYIDYLISRFQEGNLYENLSLMYGDYFSGSLLVDDDYYEEFKLNFKSYVLMNKIKGQLFVAGIDDLEGYYASLKIVDKRSNNVVFETKIPKSAIDQ